MPNVVGLGLAAAQAALQAAGVLVPASLGYFGTWPITVTWKPNIAAKGSVTAQSPAANSAIAANASVTFTVSEFSTGVVYP